MAASIHPIDPRLATRLEQLGARLRDARLRRRWSLAIVAERAGMAILTLRRVEQGHPGVAWASVAAVLHVLGLDKDLDAVAAADPVGMALLQAAMPRRGRRTNTSRTPVSTQAVEPSKPPSDPGPSSTSTTARVPSRRRSSPTPHTHSTSIQDLLAIVRQHRGDR
jgi:transcriptional regulator with XRE-family HTH domain